MNLPFGTSLQGGKYKLIRFISSGGFGCTYEAEHTLLESRVAIKEFFVKDFCNRDETTMEVSVATKSKLALIAKLKKKFLEEAKAVFKMQHPNIVRVIDIFEENGTAYYVMDYIDGQSLHEIVRKQGPLSQDKAVDYILQICDALEYVHSRNRLHLDIKPGNIMIDKGGTATLIDFGASKHYDDETGENTSTLMGVNTKGYAPIEQSTRSFTTFSPATDIYALGATLYKLLSGITPPDSVSLMSEESFVKPLPDNISENVRKAVTDAMKLKRKDRPQSIAEWRKILEDKEPNDDDATGYSAEPKVDAPVSEAVGGNGGEKGHQGKKRLIRYCVYALVAVICCGGGLWIYKSSHNGDAIEQQQNPDLNKDVILRFVDADGHYMLETIIPQLTVGFYSDPNNVIETSPDGKSYRIPYNTIEGSNSDIKISVTYHGVNMLGKGFDNTIDMRLLNDTVDIPLSVKSSDITLYSDLEKGISTNEYRSYSNRVDEVADRNLGYHAILTRLLDKYRPLPEPQKEDSNNSSEKDGLTSPVQENNSNTSNTADKGNSGSNSNQSSTTTGTGRGKVGGGWIIPAYGSVRSTVTGSVNLTVKIDKTGRVVSVTVTGGTPPAATDAGVRSSIEREIRAHKFTRASYEDAGPATAYITYTFR